MPGETNLTHLLEHASPCLNEGEFVFCSLTSFAGFNWRQAIGIFQEKEGVTVVVSRELAEELGQPVDAIFFWITLQVHCSLEAVGLTAAFSTKLAAAGISCNVMSAYHHDHIFVPRHDALKAMGVLSTLTEKGSK